MRRILYHLMLVSAATSLVACQDGQGPTGGSVALRTDPVDVTLATPQQAPRAISIYLKNEGPAPITVRMCNNGGFPGADLTLQVRDTSGTFLTFIASPWITCNNPADGYDLTIRPNQEKPIGRLLAAPKPGEFRYQLVYINSEGKTGVVSSNVFVAHPAP